MYYNTTNETGLELKQSVSTAKNQQQMVLEFFERNPNRRYTPFEVLSALGINAPVTSIRRAMTDLTDAGKLLKTDTKKLGQYGKMNYTWMYRFTDRLF